MILIFVATSFADLTFNSKTSDFSFQLLYKTQLETDGDVAISPFAIWSLLLSIAYETSGVTREQVSKVFALPGDRSEIVKGFTDLRTSLLDSRSVNITLVNFLFYDENLRVNSDSIRKLADDFNFITRRLDFGESQKAKDSTSLIFKEHGVKSIAAMNILTNSDFVESTMIMCNYLAFDAKWAQPFNVFKTVKYRNGNKIAEENIMSKTARFRCSNFESLKASVTELPYEDENFCLLLIRPYDGYSVKQVYENIKTIPLNDVLAKLQSDEDKYGLKEIEVKLPFYYNHSGTILNRPLLNLGFTDAFDENFANFDYFSEDEMYISEIGYRAYIFITEKYTNIYTHTPGSTSRRRRPQMESMVMDPFIYLIMEKTTGTLLFGGSHVKIQHMF